jgi:hypothetical protein
MWGVPTGAEISNSPKLQAMFGVTSPVDPGRIYGAADEGTARVLYVPRVIHPGEHLSTAAIGFAIDWFQRTLHGGTPKPATDQIWYWKEFGTLIALGGMVLAIVGFGLSLLRLRRFREFVKPVPMTSAGRWPIVRAVLTAVVPVLTLFPLFNLAAAKCVSVVANN